MKKIMFSKIILFFIILVLIFMMFQTYTFCAGEPGDVIWEKTYGGNYLQVAPSIIQTTKGG
jgi:hypothetical protein